MGNARRSLLMLRASARKLRGAPLILRLPAFALPLTSLAVKSVGILRNCCFSMPQPLFLSASGRSSFAEGSRGRNGARSDALRQLFIQRFRRLQRCALGLPWFVPWRAWVRRRLVASCQSARKGCVLPLPSPAGGAASPR